MAEEQKEAIRAEPKVVGFIEYYKRGDKPELVKKQKIVAQMPKIKSTISELQAKNPDYIIKLN